MKINVIVCILACILLSGCSWLTEKVGMPEFYEKTPLNIAKPNPIVLNNPHIYTITPDTANTVFQNLKDSGQPQVLYGYSEEGYKQQLENDHKVENKFTEYGAILKAYKDYYESPKPPKEQ